MLRVIVLTQYRRLTDRRTDEIAVASTAHAMRALQRAVKTEPGTKYKNNMLQCEVYTHRKMADCKE